VQPAAGTQGGDMLVSPITKIIAAGSQRALILTTAGRLRVHKGGDRENRRDTAAGAFEGVVAEVSLKDELKLASSWRSSSTPAV
jgi:hypothetical protein